MEAAPEFHAWSAEHLAVILLTLALPFALAAFVRQTGSRLLERAIVLGLALVLVGNYVGYLVFIRSRTLMTWEQMLPMQMCDWAMVVILVAMWTGWRRWFEVAYFWGIGGTLQAVLTPNLAFGFPDPRFFAFFISHSGIIVGVIFLMLTRRLRPHLISGGARFPLVGSLFCQRAQHRPAHRRELRLSAAQTGSLFAS